VPQHSRFPSLPDVANATSSFSTNITSPSVPGSPGPVHYSPSIHPSTRAQTPVSSPSRHSTSTTSASLPSPSFIHSQSSFGSTGSSRGPFTVAGTSPEQQPYRDPRSSVSAYFMIYCPSATGNSQTRFSSSPDVFKISQSWGWRSSALLNDEPAAELLVKSQSSSDGLESLGNREISLRATVILGLV
jgi:hypothetical protein